MVSFGFYLHFSDAIKNYTNDTDLIDRLWIDIVDHYSEPSRHYHTLKHLEALVNELTEVRENISDWNLVVFAIAYHDIIYNPLKNNNEEKSAEYSAKVLSGFLTVPSMEKCRQMIIATKNHELNNDADINYFTDADLSILGTASNEYQIYSEQIRKEYRYYPAIIYKPGRQKVLKHFLAMNRIYKTDYFFKKYEQQARINLSNELKELFNN